MDVSCHRTFLPGTSLEPAVIPIAQASSFTLQYLPNYVWCSKYTCLWVVNLSNVFLVQLPNFFLSFSLLIHWLQLLLVQSYISGSTFVVSLYINFRILTSFPLPFAQHFCLRVLPHLSVCMSSIFCFLIIISGLFAVTCLSVCTAWFHYTVTSPSSYTGLGMCVYHLLFSSSSSSSSYYYYYYYSYIHTTQQFMLQNMNCCQTNAPSTHIWR